MRKKIFWLMLILGVVCLVVFITKEKPEKSKETSPLSPKIEKFKYGNYFTFSGGGAEDTDLYYSIGKEKINYMIERTSKDYERKRELYWYQSGLDMASLKEQELKVNSENTALAWWSRTNVILEATKIAKYRLNSGLGFINLKGKFFDLESIFGKKYQFNGIIVSHSIEKDREFFITFNTEDEDDVTQAQTVYVLEQSGNILQRKDISSFYQENLGLSFEYILDDYLIRHEEELTEVNKRAYVKMPNLDIYTDNQYLYFLNLVEKKSRY